MRVGSTGHFIGRNRLRVGSTGYHIGGRRLVPRCRPCYYSSPPPVPALLAALWYPHTHSSLPQRFLTVLALCTDRRTPHYHCVCSQY
eukprot:1341897-Rhodomonas_salina.1